MPWTAQVCMLPYFVVTEMNEQWKGYSEQFCLLFIMTAVCAPDSSKQMILNKLIIMDSFLFVQLQGSKDNDR